MNKLRWLSLLMGITILGVTAFQIYWLKQNYDREKKALGIRMDVSFRETMLQLQASKLKLDMILDSTADHGVRVFVGDKGEKMAMRFSPREKIISNINVIRDKYTDSLKKKKTKKGDMVISLNKTTSYSIESDSIKFDTRIPAAGKDRIFRFLYGVDSLQDSIKVSEVEKAYKKVLEEQNLSIPFEIIKTDSGEIFDDPVPNEVTVGFAKPVTFKMVPGNTFTYLIKKISLPILFSVLLMGITIISFWLLYKNMLKQQRLAELKNEFISNITHELKTPIATVGVAIEALKNFNAMQNPERTREYLDISSNELQRLNLLVDKVLKLSMFEKKAIELRFETVDATELINEVVASLKLQLEKNNAQISVRCEGDLHLRGDRLHLQSVIFNLLDNALKYSKENPAISIEAKEKEDSIELKVKDNGIGIPAEYQGKIFDKFFRVPHGDTHNAKGYGLGLSYVAQVIAGHNGSIVVNSNTNEGTTFTITLPKQKI